MRPEDVEKAILETLIIENKDSVKYAVYKIMKLYNPDWDFNRAFKLNAINDPEPRIICECPEGKQGRVVDENWEQVCDICGGY